MWLWIWEERRAGAMTIEATPLPSERARMRDMLFPNMTDFYFLEYTVDSIIYLPFHTTYPHLLFATLVAFDRPREGVCKAQAHMVPVRYDFAFTYFTFSRGDRLGQPILTFGSGRRELRIGKGGYSGGI